MTVFESRFHAVESGFLASGIGFRIPTISGIPESLSCIPDSKAQDS